MRATGRSVLWEGESLLGLPGLFGLSGWADRNLIRGTKETGQTKEAYSRATDAGGIFQPPEKNRPALLWHTGAAIRPG